MTRFSEHVDLVGHWLDRRDELADTIERSLLNVQGKPLSHLRNRQAFDEILVSCFYGAPGLPRDLMRLKGHLAARHVADGFEPLALERFPNELDPLELVVRAYDHWDRSRWPGRSGRLTYAQTIYYVFLLRQLEYLSLRIWDDGAEGAAGHLGEVQRLLDQLNSGRVPAPFVRDVRWLIHTAQGPVTRRLAPYFETAGLIATSFALPERLVVHSAGARLAGGHLRSQLRYAAWRTGNAIDDPAVLASTRSSNSMDGGLLVRDLIALMTAYAVSEGAEDRLALADAIVQGLSADPELLVTRLDLLGPYTMVEDLFVERVHDVLRHTPMGAAHVGRIETYSDLLSRLAGRLREDAAFVDPAGKAYSPYGVAYGFAADILSNMAWDTLLGHEPSGLTMEDMFVSQGRLAEKSALAERWRMLPKREGERDHFEHSAEYAALVVGRVTRALEARARSADRPNASDVRTAALFISTIDHPVAVAPPEAINANEQCFTSDLAHAHTAGWSPLPNAQMLEDRREARYLGSAEDNGKWFGVSKALLTLELAAGRDAVVTGVPLPVRDVLRLTCPDVMAPLLSPAAVNEPDDIRVFITGPPVRPPENS